MNLIKQKKNIFILVNNLISLLGPKLIKKIIIKLNVNTIFIHLEKSDLNFVLNFLKNHINYQFKSLISITAVDYPNKKDRFEVCYLLLSYKLNLRLIIKVQTNDTNPIESCSNIYKGASWYEREVWDLFGVFFSNHSDLRRILTDYGFDGFPFRKDFPQTGFLEVRYDDEKKYVLYEPLEIAQEYRSFNFNSSWLQVK